MNLFSVPGAQQASKQARKQAALALPRSYTGHLGAVNPNKKERNHGSLRELSKILSAIDNAEWKGNRHAKKKMGKNLRKEECIACRPLCLVKKIALPE